MDGKTVLEFTPQLHKKYLFFVLNEKMPPFLCQMDTNRSVLMYFAVAGLDVLNELDGYPDEKKRATVEWIYSLQVINERELVSGFQGSTALNTKDNSEQNAPYQWGHIPNTYSSLATLLMLGDDLSRINRRAIVNSLKVLQLENGSYKGAVEGVEDDMRFVYCAACISYILDDWTGVDVERMVNFILNSISYDGGIGQGPGLEAHCGSTFCAVASLALSNNLDRLNKAQVKALQRWLIFRFDGGFNGRPNKPVDTCYSFWTGGALILLNAYHFIHDEQNSQFVLMTQDRYGGFSKWPNTVPDPMHTYLGLAGLSLMKVESLSRMSCALNITERTMKHLEAIQAKWKK